MHTITACSNKMQMIHSRWTGTLFQIPRRSCSADGLAGPVNSSVSMYPTDGHHGLSLFDEFLKRERTEAAD